MTDISDKYNQPEIRRILGQSTTAELVCPDGVGHFQHFQGGSIYWHPNTGAHEVHGAIRAKWTALGWERSFLRYPLTDETATPDGRGRYNHFQGGSIYWTPETGAHEVHGAIKAKWAELDWEKFFGYPVTDETATTDGQGRYNHFEDGSIYWHPNTGAHEVHGAIRNTWKDLNWEKSYLGYPVTNELITPGHLRFQKFQGGTLLWTPQRGVWEVPGAETHYLAGVSSFHIDCTRAVDDDTDHIAIGVKINSDKMLEIPVIHVGDVDDGDHVVDFYSDPFELTKLTDVVTFNFSITNIGSDDYAAIENGLKEASKAGLTYAFGPVGGAIAEIASKIYDFFSANCDGPVAVDQVVASGHLINQKSKDSHVYSATKHYTYESQTFCGDSPQYDVTWCIIRL